MMDTCFFFFCYGQTKVKVVGILRALNSDGGKEGCKYQSIRKSDAIWLLNAAAAPRPIYPRDTYRYKMVYFSAVPNNAASNY